MAAVLLVEKAIDDLSDRSQSVTSLTVSVMDLCFE